MSGLDWAILGLFLAATATVGLLLRSRGSDPESYFLGERRVGVPLALLSLVATETSAVSFLSVPAESLRGDLRFLQLPLGYIVGRVAVAVWVVPLLFRGQYLTLYEALQARSGSLTQRATSAIFVVTRTLADGLRLFLTALLVRHILGASLEIAILVAGGLTILYASIGGIKAVLWTDAIQLVVYVFGAFVAVWLLVGQSFTGLGEMLASAAAAGKLQLIDFQLDLSVPYTFWSGVIGGAFLSAATHGADQMMVQRYLCTGSVWRARWVLVLSGFVVFLQFGLFLLVGLGLWHHLGAQVPEGVRGESLLISFIMDEMPVGLRGIIVASVIAAAMSTLSSSVNAVASAVVGDFLGARSDEPARGWQGVVATAVAGLVQVAVALGAVRLLAADAPLVRPILSVAALTTGVVLGLLLLVRNHRCADSTAMLSLLVGTVVVLFVWWQTPLAFPWFTAVGTVVTWVTGVFAQTLFYASKTDGTPD